MNAFKKVASQGDVRVERIDDDFIIPPEYSAQAPNDTGELVVAHSESGHDHVIDAERTELYSSAADAFIQYIVVKARADLRHNKTGPDAHPRLTFSPGKYKIIRQREKTPDGFQRIED